MAYTSYVDRFYAETSYGRCCWVCAPCCSVVSWRKAAPICRHNCLRSPRAHHEMDLGWHMLALWFAPNLFPQRSDAQCQGFTPEFQFWCQEASCARCMSRCLCTSRQALVSRWCKREWGIESGSALGVVVVKFVASSRADFVTTKRTTGANTKKHPTFCFGFAEGFALGETQEAPGMESCSGGRVVFQTLDVGCPFVAQSTAAQKVVCGTRNLKEETFL